MLVKVDGIDGAGKSTVAEALALWIRACGLTATVTSELGHDGERAQVGVLSGARAMVQLCLHPDTEMDEIERLLIFAAVSRRQNRIIVPQLCAEFDVVISDRSRLSGRAYSHRVRDLWHPILDQVVGPELADLTILLDVDPAIALARKVPSIFVVGGTATEDVVEREPIEYHAAVRQEYLRLVQVAQKCVVIDASRPFLAVLQSVKSIMRPLLAVDGSHE